MKRVLLIDDSQIARSLIRNIMQKQGYHICGEASNGREGAEKYKKLKPDLVFCDIMMNEMDGLACVREIMAEDANAKIIVCTAAGDELHAKDAREAGAKGFIVKPIKAADVIEVTERLIGKNTSGIKVTYKMLLEASANAAGIEGKPLLDFAEAFRQLNGFDLDDPRVDEAFLKENGHRMAVGVRALLSGKLSSDQADKLIDIFRAMVE